MSADVLFHHSVPMAYPLCVGVVERERYGGRLLFGVARAVKNDEGGVGARVSGQERD